MGDATPHRPLIIGHRGAGLPSTDPTATSENRLIGNTVSALQLAVDSNVDWIEVDVRLSQDEELVLFHDKNVAAKTEVADFDSAETGGREPRESDSDVANLSLPQLKNLALRTQSKEKILTLDDVFRTHEIPADKLSWVLDLKVSGMESQVLAWLSKSKLPRQQVILFGDYDVLKSYRDSGYRLGYTALFTTTWKTLLLDPARVLDRCDELNCHLIAVPMFFITKSFVDRATARGIDVWCYGSDDERDLKYAAACGVKGVIVDDPLSTSKVFPSKGSLPKRH